MSSDNSTYQLIEEAVYKEIEKLVYVDGYSWEALAELAGYQGQNSMKNIVNQSAHKLSFSRFLLLLKNLSRQENLRLHRFTIDTSAYMIAERPAPEQAVGSLMEDHHGMMIQMHRAEEALEAGDVDGLYDYYRQLHHLLARVQSELQGVQVMLDKKEIEGPTQRILMGKDKISPGVVSTGGIEKHNGSARPPMCKDNQNSSCQPLQQVEKEVEVTE